MTNSLLPGMDTLSLELDRLRRKAREGLLNEPEGLYIRDHPGPQVHGKQLALAYAQQNTQSNTILYAEIPQPIVRRSSTYLVSALLEQFGDASAQKRENLDRKTRRLFNLIGERHVELIILTEVHHFTTVNGTKLLLNEFDWLKYVVKEIKRIALLLVGEEPVLQSLISTNSQFARLLYPFEMADTSGPH